VTREKEEKRRERKRRKVDLIPRPEANTEDGDRTKSSGENFSPERRRRQLSQRTQIPSHRAGGEREEFGTREKSDHHPEKGKARKMASGKPIRDGRKESPERIGGDDNLFRRSKIWKKILASKGNGANPKQTIEDSPKSKLKEERRRKRTKRSCVRGETLTRQKKKSFARCRLGRLEWGEKVIRRRIPRRLLRSGRENGDP